MLWSTGKISQAKRFFERSVTAEKDLGDAWAYYYGLMITEGSKDEQNVRSITICPILVYRKTQYVYSKVQLVLQCRKEHCDVFALLV